MVDGKAEFQDVLRCDGERLPDELIPECRELFEQFRVRFRGKTHEEPLLRWVARLVYLPEADADKLLKEREEHARKQRQLQPAASPPDLPAAPSIPAISTGNIHYETSKSAVNIGKAVVSLKKPDVSIDKTSANVSKTSANVSKTSANVGKTSSSIEKASANIDMTSANAAQMSHTSLAAATRISLPPSVNTGTTTQTKKPSYNPKVGDWRCNGCGFWNNMFHKFCRGRVRKGVPCKLEKLDQNVKAVQADDGMHDTRRDGRLPGDWFCGQCNIWNPRDSEKCGMCERDVGIVCEYKMPEAPFRLETGPRNWWDNMDGREKKNAWYRINGRFLTPQKRKY